VIGSNEFKAADDLKKGASAPCRLGKRFGPSWSAMLRVHDLANSRYAERADYAFGRYCYTSGRERSVFVEIRYARP
jgi:hypothetical protein